MEIIDFDSGNTSHVEEAMRGLAARGDGLGWLNIGPGLRDDQLACLPEPSMIGKWFSGRGPIVPMATWTPATRGAKPSASIVGVQHGVGPNALDQLREAGAGLPDGWRKVQDHAKRGIVVEPKTEASTLQILQWLLSVCWALCPIEIDDQWLAEVHRPE